MNIQNGLPVVKHSKQHATSITKETPLKVSADSHIEDPRQEAVDRVWWWLQPVISLISGLPPQYQEPVFVWTRPRIYLAVACWFCTGLTLATVGVSLCLSNRLIGVLVIPVGWLLAVASSRAAMTTILHDVVHSLERHCGRNSSLVYNFWVGWLGELITIILLLPGIKSYYEEHILNHHNARVFCTLADPDAAFLNLLGFCPGKTKELLWANFWSLILWPFSILYRLYTYSRIKGQIVTWRRAFHVLVIWSVAIGIAAWCGVLSAFLIAVLVPLFFGIPLAAICQFASEHNWLVTRKASNHRQYLQKTCRGRAFIDPCPSMDLPTLTRIPLWAKWWLRLLFVHAPLRMLVCPFDLGAGHDLHHFGEKVLNKGLTVPEWASWMNAGHYRRWIEREGRQDIVLNTYYSLFEALDSVFETYATLDPCDPSIQEGVVDVDVAVGM